jgi:hypothetical protein
MPYKVFTEGGDFKLYKVDEQGNKVELVPGGDHGKDEGAAKKHMKAMYAAETNSLKKSLDELKKGYVPTGIISFADLSAWRDAQEKIQEVYDCTDDLFMLMFEVMRSPDIANKSDALLGLVKDYATMIGDELSQAPDASGDTGDTGDTGDMADMMKSEFWHEDTGLLEKAVWTTAFVNDLPDSSFLYIESGGKKDADGKTEPRSLRHLPYKDSSGKVDMPHLRNAIARIPQMTGVSASLKNQLQAKAQKMLARMNGDKAQKSWTSEVLKAYDMDRHLVYGVVLKPGTFDSQGDRISEGEIEKSAHDFFINSRLLDHQHEVELPAEKATPVESYIAPVDMMVNNHKIAKGSWVVVCHVPDEALWEDIKKGALLSYSIRGYGVRTPVA